MSPWRRYFPNLAPELPDLSRSVLRSHRAALNVELASHPVDPRERRRHWLASVYPTSITHSDKPLTAVGTVLTDITSQIEVQHDLEATVSRLLGERDEWVKTSSSKDESLSWVSHELAMPMLPVLWELGKLLKSASTPEAMRPSVQMMLDCVKVQMALINDLKDATRLRNERIVLSLEPVDMHAVTQQAVQVVRSQIDEAHLNLTTDLSATTHHVTGDARRLLQIVWNLLRNAVKFTPAGGALSVRSTSATTPEDGSLAAAMVIEVEDNGAGIDPTNLERMFLPFQQETPTRESANGLGLGLTISRALAELHGGTLTGRSEGKGKGSVFSLTLPTIPPPLVELTRHGG